MGRHGTRGHGRLLPARLPQVAHALLLDDRPPFPTQPRALPGAPQAPPSHPTVHSAGTPGLGGLRKQPPPPPPTVGPPPNKRTPLGATCPRGTPRAMPMGGGPLGVERAPPPPPTGPGRRSSRLPRALGSHAARRAPTKGSGNRPSNGRPIKGPNRWHGCLPPAWWPTGAVHAPTYARGTAVRLAARATWQRPVPTPPPPMAIPHDDAPHPGGGGGGGRGGGGQFGVLGREGGHRLPLPPLALPLTKVSR